MPTVETALGFEVPASEYCPWRSVIGEVRSTASGNVVVRIGRENTQGGHNGWHQTEHVVLTVGEARELVSRLHAAIDGDL